jgi:hypothetical protein
MSINKKQKYKPLNIFISMKTTVILMIVLGLMLVTAVDAHQANKKVILVSAVNGDHQSERQSERNLQLHQIKSLKSQIAENKARFNSLMNSENPNMEAVYQNIEESEILHNKLMQSRLQLFKLLIGSKS